MQLTSSIGYTFAAVTLLIATTVHPARALVDLSGDWIIPGPDPEPIHIDQVGTSLTYQGRSGLIDLETGKFEVLIHRDEGCPSPPLTLHGETIDANHIRLDFDGYVRIGGGYCSLQLNRGIFATRAGVIDTPTPKPTMSPTRTPTATPVPINLTGDWIVEEQLGSPPHTIHINQAGTSIVYDGQAGVIDLKTGKFEVVIHRDVGCPNPPLTRFGETIDVNHIRGMVAGNIVSLDHLCRPVNGGSFVATRAGIIDAPAPSPTTTRTPTPAATRTVSRFCAGDCDHNGRVTVAEAQGLVRCLRPMPLGAAQRCAPACADINRNGLLEINELVVAVNNLLHGCP